MSKILKAVICLIFLSFAVKLSAQTYRIEAGFVQPIRYSDNLSNRYFYGARIGGTVDFGLPVDFLTIHTGILYSYVYSDDKQIFLNGEYLKYRTQGHYIDIPVHLTYWYEFAKDAKLFAYLGPNLNIGLYQPQNIFSAITDEYTLEKLEELGIFPGEERNMYDDDLRRFNIQIEAGGGIQWRKVLLKGGYNFGLNDLSKKSQDFQRHSGWYVTFGLEF